MVAKIIKVDICVRKELNSFIITGGKRFRESL